MSNDTKPLVGNILEAAQQALRQYQSVNSWWRIWPFSASKQVKGEYLENLKKAAQALYPQEIKKINQQKNRDSIFKTAEKLMPFLRFVAWSNNEETEINALILWIEFKNHRHEQYKPTLWDKITGEKQRTQDQHHQEMQEMISILIEKTRKDLESINKRENGPTDDDIQTIKKIAITFNLYDAYLTDAQRKHLKSMLNMKKKRKILISRTSIHNLLNNTPTAANIHHSSATKDSTMASAELVLPTRNTKPEDIVALSPKQFINAVEGLEKENIFDNNYDTETASIILSQINKIISKNSKTLFKKLESDSRYAAAFTYLFLKCNQENPTAPKNTTISHFFEKIKNPIAAMHILEALLKNGENDDELKKQLKTSITPVVNKYNSKKVEESTSCWPWAKPITRETTLKSFPNVNTIYTAAINTAKSSAVHPSKQPTSLETQTERLKQDAQRRQNSPPPQTTTKHPPAPTAAHPGTGPGS